VGVLMLPILSFVLPSWQLPILPNVVASAESAVGEPSPSTPSPESNSDNNVERERTSTGLSGERQTTTSTTTPLGNAELEMITPPAPSSPGATRSQSQASSEQSNSNMGIFYPVDVFNPGNAENVQAAGQTSTPVVSDESNVWSDWNWTLVGFAIWALGAAFILARLLFGLAWVQRMSRRAKAVEDQSWLSLLNQMAYRLSIKRPVRLCQGFQPTSPLTWGIWRPVVLLPYEALNWPEDKRRVVLLHELAHVKRKDTLSQMLAQIVCALFWFHPLVWVAAQRLRVEREHACDDQVLELGTKASDYAGYLLDIALTLRSTRVASLATIAMARKSQLEGRLLAILNPSKSRQSLTPVLAGCLALVMLVVLVPLAAIQPWAPLPSQSLNGSVSAFSEATNTLPPQPPANLGAGALGHPDAEHSEHDATSAETESDSGDESGYEYDYDYNFHHNYYFDSPELGEPFVSVNENIEALNRLQLNSGSGGSDEIAEAIQKQVDALILHARKMLRLTTLQLNKLTLQFETGEEDVLSQVKNNIREFSNAYRDTMGHLESVLGNLDEQTLSEAQAQAIIRNIQTELEGEVDALSDASGRLIDAIDVYVAVYLEGHLGELGEVIAEGIGLIANQIKIEITIELRDLLLNLELLDRHANSRVIRIGDRTIIIRKNNDDEFEQWIQDELEPWHGGDVRLHITMDQIEAELESMLEGLDTTLEEMLEDIGEALEDVFDKMDDWLEVLLEEEE